MLPFRQSFMATVFSTKWLWQRQLIAAGFALALVAILAGAAQADGGPHGGYDRMVDGSVGLTDACAGCHRVHQGKSTSKLLKAAFPADVCLTCHNGQGSRLDVEDGVRRDAVGGIVSQGTLNGGGFDFLDGNPASSKHNVQRTSDPTGQTNPWGFQSDTGVAPNALPGGAVLSCTSCHNPHGSPNYRVLKEKVNDRIVSVLAYYNNALTKQEGARGLEGGAPADKYIAEFYASVSLDDTGGYQPLGSLALRPGDPTANGFALLCGACHSAYPSSSARSIPGGAQNPWGITKYRHRTEMPYTNWNSPKWGGNVPCNPETGPYNPSTEGCGGPGQLPALRLASNDSLSNEIVTCLTCHRAHGTASQMGGFALIQSLGGSSPDAISPAQTASSKSMLLFTDNRGMCEGCHQW